MSSLSMTPRERFLSALRGLPTDNVPYQEIFFQNTEVAEYFGGPQKTIMDAANWVANSGQCSLNVGGFWWCDQSNYSETSTGEKRYHQGRMWSINDVESLEEPKWEDRLDGIKEGIRAAKEKNLATHLWVMNGFHSASTAMGLENLCYCLIDAPEVLHRYIEKIENFNRKIISAISDLGIDTVFIDGDCAYKSGLMVSPEAFRDFWFEQTRQTVDLCHAKKMLCGYHTDGNVDQVIPMLIEIGIDGTHGVEKVANDFDRLKKEYGEKITLIGNFDIVDLAYNSPEQICEQTLEMIKKGGQLRYIASCNTALGENISLENYLAYHDTIINAKERL